MKIKLQKTYIRTEEQRKHISDGHKGQIPWNKEMTKDELLKHYPNGGLYENRHPFIKGGEKGWFKKGISPWKNIKNEKYKRPCMKHKGKLILVSHYVWCNQPDNLAIVPQGCVIHHKDLKPYNNEPSNLILMPKDFHTSLHNQIRIMNGERA